MIRPTLRLVAHDETPGENQDGPWGVYDTKDRCWMGNNTGPVVYDDLDTAKLSATILNERFGYAARLMPKVYAENAKVKRDEQTPMLSFEEAFSRLNE